MRETVKIREVGSVIVSKNQIVLFILQMVAITQMIYLSFFKNYRFIKFQKVPAGKTDTDTQIYTIRS